MHKINSTLSGITPLEKVTLAELGLTERNHLQEWLAENPYALGEELLIIQKEFSDFNYTSKRLDLLAIDKFGKLVIIELKRGDSGSRATSQCLEYASYCRNMLTDEIVRIYQNYLDKLSGVNDSYIMIREFLKVTKASKLVINGCKKPRIFLVAEAFRKDVTSSAVFLRDNDIDAQCFSFECYKTGVNNFIHFKRIIPIPDIKDYMIDSNEADSSVEAGKSGKLSLHDTRKAFFDKAIKVLLTSGCSILKKSIFYSDGLISVGSASKDCRYKLVMTKHGLRVELQISSDSKKVNKYIFSQLFINKNRIEYQFNRTMEWDKCDNNKGSFIRSRFVIDAYNPNNWDKMVAWQRINMVNLVKAFEKPLENAYKALEKESIRKFTDIP